MNDLETLRVAWENSELPPCEHSDRYITALEAAMKAARSAAIKEVMEFLREHGGEKANNLFLQLKERFAEELK